METRVYLCAWRRSKDGWTLWVKSRPKLRGIGLNYDDAEADLMQAIHDAGGAMHAVLEYDRPVPKSGLDAKYSNPELYLITGDDNFETNAPNRQPFESNEDRETRFCWHDAFYVDPICRKCEKATSQRSKLPLTLASAPRRNDGAFGYVGHCTAMHHVVSEEFLALLTLDEKRGLDFLTTKSAGRRRFFELIGPEGPSPVAVAGLKLNGWRCDQCGYRAWGYWVDGLSISTFVARSDLPARTNGVFTVGVYPDITLAVTAARWKELIGRKGTRGLVSSPLGVVSDAEVVRQPELPLRESVPI